MQYDIKLNMYHYWQSSRMFEDCIVIFTVNLPDNTNVECPKVDEIFIIDVEFEADTKSYLKIFHADSYVELLHEVREDVRLHDLHEIFIEQFTEDWSDKRFEEWYLL